MMTSPDVIEKALEQLGQELGTQPSLAQRVLEDVCNRAARELTPVRPKRRVWFGRRSLVAASALGLVAALTAWWLLKPATLYARVLDALDSAKTVHVSGWTREVFRKWPLEAPPKKVDGSKTRHAVDAWYWTDASEDPASYEKFGPVVVIRRGGNLREYQEDVKLLFVSEASRPKNYAERFSMLADHLKMLAAPGLSKEKLETRSEGGRSLSGWQVTQGNRREEFWLDAHSNLPVRFSRWSIRPEGNAQIFELAFSFDESVPAGVVRYEPPQTETIRYGGSSHNAELAWRQHVQDIGRRLQDEPMAGRVALLPRKNGKTFSLRQWTLPTPDHKFWVMPLDVDQQQRLSLRDFFRLRAATMVGDRAHGTWRVPREYHGLELRHDLVYADGTPWQEWAQVVLGHFGLELTDIVEQRTVWIARQDGRKLKPWADVNPPVPYIVKNGKEVKGLVAPGVGHMLRPVTMDELLMDFNTAIDSRELTARLPIIIDETGLPRAPAFDPQKYKSGQEFYDTIVKPNYCVASDAPLFEGKNSLGLAREWYAREFGITFVEEQRPMTVHVVRSKQKPD
jgi:hypothetical protein